jgi:putative peptidoglycan lipid II flippase
MVSSLVIAYGVGMFVYLGRDVIVRVFYALGDGNTPFRVSILNIFLNAAFDYLCVRVFHWGAPGLVYATVGVNALSLILLTEILHRRLGGLPLGEWTIAFTQLLGASVVIGTCTAFLNQGLSHWFPTSSLLVQLLNLGIASGVGLGLFIVLVWQFRIPEVQSFLESLKTRFLGRFLNRSS